MSSTQQILYITLTVGFAVLVVLLALVLIRVFEILRDVKEITKSARKTSRVAEVVATRIIGPVSAILGTGSGVKRGAKVLLRKRRK